MITPNVSAVVFISGWYKTEGDSPATDEDNCMDKSYRPVTSSTLLILHTA